MILLLGLFHNPALAGAANRCEQTSDKAWFACSSAAHGDYWLALAKCDNLADPAARTACRQQAAADLKEALTLCKEQQDAREDVCDRLGGAPYDPIIQPSNFVATINNPYFPLTPGTTYTYEGQTAEGLERAVKAVTRNTKLILGVTCVEVRDVVTLNGSVIEDTLDWFAQDRQGNVWYFGEYSQRINGGFVVSLAGSWVGGVDGAKPGIVMKARPAVRDIYRQEFYLGTAEDMGEVLGLTATVTVPGGTFTQCVQTKDTTPLEPDALEHKFYAPGIGFVLATHPNSGEKLELIRITRE